MADAESLFAALAEDVRAALGEVKPSPCGTAPRRPSSFASTGRGCARPGRCGKPRRASSWFAMAVMPTSASRCPASRRPIASALPMGCCNCARQLPSCSPTPTCCWSATRGSACWPTAAAPPDSSEVLAQIEAAAHGLDLVGIYAAGPLYRGFANSFGAFGWHAAQGFHFDWSLFHANGQAVKADYAGARWDAAEYCQPLCGCAPAAGTPGPAAARPVAGRLPRLSGPRRARGGGGHALMGRLLGPRAGAEGKSAAAPV
ncbi:hypothetical protein ACU4GD_34855 [Cupriavidus basilensis]